MVASQHSRLDIPTTREREREERERRETVKPSRLFRKKTKTSFFNELVDVPFSSRSR